MQKHGAVTMTKQNTIVLINNTMGFTLLETMIALMVLTIGVLGIMVMQTTAIRSNAKASSMTIASNIAASQIEGIRNTPFLNLPSIGSDVTTNDPTTGFPVRVQVAAGAVANSKLITITITRPGSAANVVCSYIAIPDIFLQAQI